ncbi:MAG: hypothetical protein WKF83_12825 [Nocardioidaceae bacterium]
MLRATSGPEGYVEATLDVPDLSPGWHEVTFAHHQRAGLLRPGPAARRRP